MTSWLHEEGTAIEIFPERDPRGKYTLLQSGDLLVHHTSTYDTYKKYVCKTEHLLSGIRRRSLVPARLTLKGNVKKSHGIGNFPIPMNQLITKSREQAYSVQYGGTVRTVRVRTIL